MKGEGVKINQELKSPRKSEMKKSDDSPTIIQKSPSLRKSNLHSLNLDLKSKP